MKSIFQSKTFWSGIATIATGIGLYASGEQELQELIISVVGFVFIILRCYTTTSVE